MSASPNSLRASIVVSATLGTLCMAAALVATARYGPGYSSDAVTYLATARHLADGAGFFSHEGLYVKWPPLFPLLLAGAERLGWKAIAAARWINALCYGGTVAVTAVLVWQTVRSRGWAWWGSLAVAFSSPLLVQAVKAQTEPLFVLFVVLFVAAAAHHLRAPTVRSTVGWMACWAALACLQRYAGVWLIGGGAGLILLSPFLMGRRSEASWTKRLFRAGVFSAVAAAPLGGWLLRNRLVAGTLTQRSEPPHTLGESLTATADVLTGWSLPPVVPTPGRAALVLGALLLLGLAVWRWGGRPSLETTSCRLRRKSICRTSGFMVLLYVLFIVLTATFEASSLPGRRLLMPAFPLVILLAVGALDATAARLASTGHGWGRRLLLGLGTVWLLYPLALSTAYVLTRADLGGGGYNTTAWQTSATARWVRTHDLGAPVRSNDPHALYFLTGRQQPRTPSRSGGYIVACFEDPRRARLHPRVLAHHLLAWVPGVSAEAVALPALPPSRWQTPDCLAPPLVPEDAQVTQAASRADGTVYRVEID